MKAFVDDAGILVRLVLPEDHSEACAALWRSGARILAPDLIHTEAANVVWKRVRRGEIDLPEADATLATLLKAPLEVEPVKPLLAAALGIAVSSGRTVYDCVYVALARRERCPLVTADQRLANALAGTAAPRVLWIGSIPGKTR